MNNSYENLPEEYENDGNTYCHGIVNCKYYHEGCNFMYMGSGDPDDMPCRVQEQNDLKAFLEWREKQEQAKELEERLQGEWIIIYSENNIKTCKCSECGRIEDIVDFSKYPFCHCGADMRGANNG